MDNYCVDTLTDNLIQLSNDIPSNQIYFFLNYFRSKQEAASFPDHRRSSSYDVLRHRHPISPTRDVVDHEPN